MPFSIWHFGNSQWLPHLFIDVAACSKTLESRVLVVFSLLVMDKENYGILFVTFLAQMSIPSAVAHADGHDADAPVSGMLI